MLSWEEKALSNPDNATVIRGWELKEQNCQHSLGGMVYPLGCQLQRH